MHLCMLLGRFWHMLSPDTTWVPFSKFIYLFIGFLGSAVVKNPPATVGDTRDIGSIPGSGRSPGEGNSSPLQYFCLENSRDWGAWQAIAHGVTRVVHNLATEPPPYLIQIGPCVIGQDIWLVTSCLSIILLNEVIWLTSCQSDRKEIHSFACFQLNILSLIISQPSLCKMSAIWILK